MRAQTLSLREREFVLAARSLGAKPDRIMFREILPNLVPAMLSVAFTGLAILIAAEGALAFLGLGVEVGTPTWGKMIDENRNKHRRVLVGDDLPVPDALPHRALVQHPRRPSRPSLRHPGGCAVSDARSIAGASRPRHRGPLLEVTDVTTHFKTPRGLVRAVDGVSFTLERGKTLGIVGESGSGKTVLSRSIMGLLPPRGTRSRTGSDQVRGPRDRQTSTASDARALGQGDGDDLPGPDDLAQPGDEDRRTRSPSRCAIHLGMTKAERAGDRRRACCERVRHPRGRRDASSSTRTSCPAACASA